MNREVILSVLIGALACVAVGITLLARSFTESSSLFVTAAEAVRGSNEFQQYLAMIFMVIGAAITVFIKKYWRYF